MVAEIERRMRAGGWFTHPMLGRNDALEAILEADARALAALGTTAALLGTRLAELLATTPETDWFRPFRSGPLEIELRRRRGLISCPWAPDEFEPCRYGEGFRPSADEFLVRNRESGRELEGRVLSIHLIRDHGYFGGPGTEFRLEPADVVSVLKPES